ncbi:alpha/beta fold hydrolase [Actinoallomurus sp. NPDC050550]|uniref:alpha/beta fold hydrolase n=1 Tax=Actinoallomurus sp. NPDC050550 TaxID=3154937 RepID=UPI0033E053C2
MIQHRTTGQGPDLVLIHGVGLDRSMWDRCLPELTRHHRVTVVDLRGHGRSPRAEPGVTAADLAADIAEVAAGSSHVVGFSLGALVAQELALAAPARVRSLTLVSSVAGRGEDEAAAVRARLEGAAADFKGAARAAVERWFSDEWTAREPQLRREVLATLLANDRASYLACYAVFATADRDLWHRLGEISAPTLAVTGSDDPGSTPAMTRRLAAAIPGARSLIIPGARHLLPLERPAELCHAILTHVRSASADIRHEPSTASASHRR